MASTETKKKKAAESTLSMQGRFQEISADPGENITRPVFAAGAVLWRGDPLSPNGVEIALIHRPHYDDWSLAKGKLDPGESLPVTAIREIREETGFHVSLGKLLGSVSYPVGNRTKVVYYWTAEVKGGKFIVNNEVDEIRWLPVAQARELVTYAVDRKIIDKAVKRITPPRTAQLLLVRHAKDIKQKSWQGNQDLRPLDRKGRRQAEVLAPLLEAYKPDTLHAALPNRCVETITPFAAASGLSIEVADTYSNEQWNNQSDQVITAAEKLVEQGDTHVISSQNLVIPGLVEHFAQKSGIHLTGVTAKKASVWVLSFAGDTLTGADYLESPLPVK